jgi:hypothetical protein
MKRDLKLSTERILLLLIVGVAALLRFWNYSRIPYMHDELSALSRTNYKSVQDVLDYGVAIYDTHPAGVQLFLYYWTKLFGYGEMIVKLPFILAGLLSIVVAYGLARKWFNSSVGLIVAAFMACLQYMVMYGEIARPYITGMLFCLLTVWFWSAYFFEEGNKKRQLAGYILFSVLCAYNHHFSFLFAGIVGLSGFFFLNRGNWKGYILSGFAIAVLYLPHVNIFLFQLGKGGLGGGTGWLGKPDDNWLLDYFRYVFHFSSWIYALVLFLVMLSFLRYSADVTKTNKFRVLSISWFFVLFFIEYYYSRKVSPVIQQSTLIFAFPFLLIFLFSMLREVSARAKTGLTILILGAGSLSLTLERKHFDVFYKQPYEQIYLNSCKYQDLAGGEQNATTVLMFPPAFKELYVKKYGRDIKNVYFNPFADYFVPQYKQFKTFVAAQNTNFFIAGNLPEEFLEIIQEKYSLCLAKKEGFTYSTACFAKHFDEPSWPHFYWIQKSGSPEKLQQEEYSAAEYIDLKGLKDKHLKLAICARLFTSDSSSNPIVVAELQENDSTIEWMGAEYKLFNNNKYEPNTVYLCRSLTHFDLKSHPNRKLKVYVWNRDKKDLQIDFIRTEIVEENKLLYGLFEPID